MTAFNLARRKNKIPRWTMYREWRRLKLIRDTTSPEIPPPKSTISIVDKMCHMSITEKTQQLPY